MTALDYVVKEYQRHKQPFGVNALDNTVAAAVRVGVVVCSAAGNAGGPLFIPE
jgi:hypothetical protein